MVPMDERHRHEAHRLHGPGAGQPRDFAARAIVGGFHRPHRDVAAQREVELRVDDDVDRITHEVAEHDDRHRGRHAEHGQPRAQRPPLEVADDHAQARRHALNAQALEQRAPEVVGGRWAHRLGRRKSHAGEDGIQGAEHRGGHRDQRARRDQPRRHLVHEGRKVKELGVQAGQQRAEPVAQRHAKHQPTGHDEQHQLQVVAGDLPVGVAHRLQRGDLLALRRHQARHHHVEQKGRHRQEDHRQHGAQHPLLLDLVVEHRVRGLLCTAVRLAPAVAGQQRTHLLRGRALAGPWRELDRQVVDRPLHVVRSGQRVVIDPEDAETAQVGHAKHAGEDVFGRQRSPHHHQRAPLAVDQRVQPRAGLQAVGLREAFGDQRFERTVAAWRVAVEHAAAGQHHLVHPPRRLAVDADQVSEDGIAAALDVDANRVLHRALHVGHAGHGQQPLLQRLGRALDHGEHLGEAPLRIEAVACRGERFHRRQAGHEAADAAGHHQRNGQRLAPHATEVAQQLAVERADANPLGPSALSLREGIRSRGRPCRAHAHHDSSAGAIFCSLRSMRRIRPSPKCTTRSAMPAMAALCVITMAVVPSSRLMRSITSSTSLPVW